MITERRGQQRCVKNVGMSCMLMNGKDSRPAILRNFSDQGVYFETTLKVMKGAYVVLRALNRNDNKDSTMGHRGPLYTLDTSDPDVCSLFRSHAVAQVRRCERLADHDDPMRYGVAAEIEALTD